VRKKSTKSARRCALSRVSNSDRRQAEAGGSDVLGLCRFNTKPMNIIEHPQPRAQAPTRGMLLHCGAQTVSREDLLAVPTPRGTRTWYPLSHSTILGEVETQLESSGFTIIEETHALSHEGARYFGVNQERAHQRPTFRFQLSAFSFFFHARPKRRRSLGCAFCPSLPWHNGSQQNRVHSRDPSLSPRIEQVALHPQPHLFCTARG